MKYQEASTRIIEAANCPGAQIRWCNERRFHDENTEYAPGAFLTKWGYWVVGTTIGGNAIVLSVRDDSVRFAGRSWFRDDGISYEELGINLWHDLDYSQKNVDAALIILADTMRMFVGKIKTGEIDEWLNKYD